MMWRLGLLVIGFTACAADEYGSYPATYPFESDEAEGVKGTDLVDMPDTGMPEFTFDETDTGGYYLYGAYKQTMDGQAGPAFYAIGGSLEPSDGYFWFPEHLGVGLWGGFRLSTSPLSSWNCTGLGAKYSQDDFPGIQNAQTICTECCANYVGEFKFGDGTQARQELFADLVKTNGCATMTEEVYCATGDDWHWLCLENYVTRADRLFMKPCLDNFAFHLAKCSLLKASGAHAQLKAIFCEPESYIDSMSNLQTVSMYSLEYTTFDKVCLPYSYYHPSEDVTTSASDSATMSVCFAQLLAATTAVFQLLATAQ